METIHHGLEGIYVGETRLSHVNGLEGELIIAGFPLEKFVEADSFEKASYTLVYGKAPNSEELDNWKKSLLKYRNLDNTTLRTIHESVTKNFVVMDTLRTAMSTIAFEKEEEVPAILASVPLMVAACWRLTSGQEVILPKENLSHAANYLYMIDGKVPTAEKTMAMDTYLKTVIDHGMNASTFTARVITSTESDLLSAITGAIGALKGPLHGGAPGPVLDMILEIEEGDKVEACLRQKLESKEKLMGFGHRVYKVRDPRADVLDQACRNLYEEEDCFYQLAMTIEKTVLNLLEEYKPGRKLQTNVEYYTALLLHGIGIPKELFTATFAVGRVGGWLAHCSEQKSNNRLIRPKVKYVGNRNAKWQAC